MAQDNVLIDDSGNLRLTNFGLATVEGEAKLQLNTMTAEHSFDTRWRASEVVGIEDDPERPNFKSDIYSYSGVIFLSQLSSPLISLPSILRHFFVW